MACIRPGSGTGCLCVHDKNAVLVRGEFGRPAAGPRDVEIDIQFCGMCHSDVHASNGDWGLDAMPNFYPFTPGHEIAGTVRAVGDKVTKFKVGDRVGVGCMVNSCKSCDLCTAGAEQHCPKMIQTYSSPYPDGDGVSKDVAGKITNGGYSTSITVVDEFVLPIPANLKLEHAGPLLCAGITTFSPLNRHILKKGGGKGKKVGVVGFGGLGHMAVKLAHAMGAEVHVISRSLAKEAEAKAIGATGIVVHTDEDAVKAATRKFDVILDTVSAEHGVEKLLGMTAVFGTYVLIGGVPTPFPVSAMQLLFNHISIEGSLIGSIGETNEMLQFCAEHNVVPDIKIIDAQDAAAQFTALINGSAGARRAVIDMSTLSKMSKSN
jgi:uncharacterized zinc-type alcohol dehydrogenase-like protein